MLRKIYLIPADRFHGSSFMTREPALSIRKHWDTVKKRNHHNPYAQAVKIRKMDEDDLRKKTETYAFAEFLSRVIPTEQASKISPPPPPPTTPQKMRRVTQTTVTWASVNVTPPQPIKEFKHEPPNQERVEEDGNDDEDYYDEENNFVEDVARDYGREKVGPVASPYMMPYVYKGRFLDTQYLVRKDGDMFMIGDSPIVVDTVGDITIKERLFKG